MLEVETDPEMREMAKMEIDELETSRPIMEEEIKIMLIYSTQTLFLQL